MSQLGMDLKHVFADTRTLGDIRWVWDKTYKIGDRFEFSYFDGGNWDIVLSHPIYIYIIK